MIDCGMDTGLPAESVANHGGVHVHIDMHSIMTSMQHSALSLSGQIKPGLHIHFHCNKVSQANDAFRPNAIIALATYAYLQMVG